MNIELIVVGKTDMKEVSALVEMYTKRINHYAKFAITYLPDLRNTKNLSEQQQKVAEGEMLLKDITAADYVVLLDEAGEACPLNLTINGEFTIGGEARQKASLIR